MLSFPLADQAACGTTQTRCGELSPLSCFKLVKLPLLLLLRSIFQKCTVDSNARGVVFIKTGSRHEPRIITSSETYV